MRAGSGSSAPSAPSTARLTPNRPSMRPRLRSSSAAFSAGAVNSSSTARAAMAGAASRGGAGGRRRRRPLSVLPLHRSPSGGVGPRGRLAPARAPPPARGPSYTIPARPPQLGNCGQRTPPPLRRRRRRRGPGPAAAHAPGLPPSLMLAAPQGRREGGGDRTRRHAPWPCLLRARRRLRRGARTAFFGEGRTLLGDLIDGESLVLQIGKLTQCHKGFGLSSDILKPKLGL